MSVIIFLRHSVDWQLHVGLLRKNTTSTSLTEKLPINLITELINAIDC